MYLDFTDLGFLSWWVNECEFFHQKMKFNGLKIVSIVLHFISDLKKRSHQLLVLFIHNKIYFSSGLINFF